MPAESTAGRSLQVDRRAPVAVLLHTARRTVRSGVLWGYVFGAFVASSALSYSTIYRTRAERDRLEAAFGSNHAASALFGPAPQLQNVAGFTVYKTSLTVMVIGAVWGLLTSTRLLRGEEDSGRWELLLTGQTTRRRAVLQALGGFLLATVAMWAVTSMIVVLVGRSARFHIAVGAGLYFSLALVSGAVEFLAIGALTSQLAATRRQAAGWAGVILGIGYALRLVGDAGIGLGWLDWLSPVGWVEQLRPLTAPHPLALLPIGLLAVLASLASVGLAGARDLGASVIVDSGSRRARTTWLGGQAGLSARLMRPTVVAWTCAIAVSAWLTGVVARAAGSTITGSSVRQIFDRFGATGAGVKAFLGVSFLIVAVLVGFLAAGQVTAARSEEADGHLEQLLSQPVRRSGWLGGRLALAVGALLAGGIAAGVFSWLGAASQHSGVPLGTLVSAGLNIVPPAVLVLGVGSLSIGLWPRATSFVVYAVLVWSFAVQLVDGLVAQNHWLLDTSVFHQMAASPAVAPHWEANGVMVALGALAAIAGVASFGRRDIVGQ